MRKLKTLPNTLTDFRTLGKKKRGNRSAEAAKALHDQRIAARIKNKPNLTLAAWWQSGRRGGYRAPDCANVIPLGLGGHQIERTGHPRAKNWTSPTPTMSYSAVIVRDLGQYSRSCKYHRMSYSQGTESWGIALNGHLRAKIDTGGKVESINYRPCRGWHWMIDKNGIALVDSDGKRDYHPTVIEILANRTTAAMAKLAVIAEEARKAARKIERETRAQFARAEKEGLTVCLSDSLVAGNCRGGTLTWAQRHGFQIGKHYTPNQLLSLSNGDTDRVRIVIAVALRRHLNEMRQGYAELQYHTTR